MISQENKQIHFVLVRIKCNLTKDSQDDETQSEKKEQHFKENKTLTDVHMNTAASHLICLEGVAVLWTLSVCVFW